MKIITLLLIITALFLTACGSQPGKQIPAVDDVATMVAQALTSYPTDTRQPTTAIPPTTTAPVTDTPTVIIPTTTITPSPATPTPELAYRQGEPIWRDSFDNGKNWGLESTGYSDDNSKIIIENGSLSLTSLNAAGWQSWRLGGQNIGNGYVEAVITTGICSGSDTYGMILRAPDYTSGQGYYLELTCDGQYAFSVWDSTSSRKLIDFTSSTAISPGAGQTNRFGIWLDGNQIKLYANDSLLSEHTDNSIPDSGHLGFFIISYNTPGFQYSVEEVSIWK